MTVTRAQVVSVKNGRGSLISPEFMSNRLIAPCGCNMERMTSRDANCGTATDREKIARHTFFPTVVRRLIIMATNMPRK